MSGIWPRSAGGGWNWTTPPGHLALDIPPGFAPMSDSPKHIGAATDDPETLLTRQLRGAVARGWCDDKNALKEMDTDLAESIVKELLLSLDPACHPARALPLVAAPSPDAIARFLRTVTSLIGEEPGADSPNAIVWAWLRGLA